MAHILQLVMGGSNERMPPFSRLFGTIFLVWAEIAAHVVMAPEDMPIAVATGLIGEVFFVGLLARRRK